MQSATHPQDDLLIIEALDEIADQLNQSNAHRSTHTRHLAREIAAIHGLDVADALFQIDQDFGRQRYPPARGSRPDTESRESTSE